MTAVDTGGGTDTVETTETGVTVSTYDETTGMFDGSNDTGTLLGMIVVTDGAITIVFDVYNV
jgi:hypothetical protein